MFQSLVRWLGDGDAWSISGRNGGSERERGSLCSPTCVIYTRHISRGNAVMSLWRAFKKNVLAFKPGSTPFYLAANKKAAGSPEGGAYRYPAPGSRPQGNVPTQSTDDLLYDIKYYTRDSRRHPKPAFVITGPKTEKPMLANSAPLPLLGSPGNNNDDVLKYDSTGLRSAMSANHAAHQIALTKVRPTHLPEPRWVASQAAILADLKSKGLPPVPGAPTAWKFPFDVKRDHPANRW